MVMNFTSKIKTFEKSGWEYEYIEWDVIVDGESIGRKYIMSDVITEEEEDKIDEMIAELKKQNRATFSADTTDDQKYSQIQMMGIKPINY